MKYMILGGEFHDECFYYDSLEEAMKHNSSVIFLVQTVFVREEITPEYKWVAKEMEYGSIRLDFL